MFRPIRDPIEKANSLNYYYSSALNSESNIPHIQCADPCEPFTSDIKVIRKTVAAIREKKNKSVGADSISGEILKLRGESMIPYLARLLDITMKNITLPAYWKRAIMIPIHKGGG